MSRLFVPLKRLLEAPDEAALRDVARVARRLRPERPTTSSSSMMPDRRRRRPRLEAQ